MSISFKVDNVEPATSRVPEQPVIEHLQKYHKMDKIEACSEGQVIHSQFNPLVQAAMLAFDRHYPLSISPDHIWLTIAKGLAIHINENAEEMRHHFVDFEGKKYLEIERHGFVKGSQSNDWVGCFPEFSDKLAEFIGKKRDLIVSNFSTTGLIEKAASELVLMDAMSSYFEYGMRTMCGFPQITLEGTENDWADICYRVQCLNELGLSWWTKHLEPIMDAILQTAQGEISIPFWKSFLKIGGGSGGPYVTGWINTLFPYTISYRSGYDRNHTLGDTPNEWYSRLGSMCGGPTPEKFPKGLSRIPMIWHYFDIDYNMELAGGLVGVEQKPDLTLRPMAGWAVREV